MFQPISLKKTIKDMEIDTFDDIQFKKLVEEADKERFFALKKADREFVDDIMQKEPIWCRERRVEHLDNQLADLKLDINKDQITVETCKGKVYQWAGSLVEQIYLLPKLKKLRKMQIERERWFSYEKGDATDERDIEEARAADCSQYLHVVRKDGPRSWALCPFHNDHKPSLCCYSKGRGFYCFSCGKGGDAIALVRELNNFGFDEAIKYILNK